MILGGDVKTVQWGCQPPWVDDGGRRKMTLVLSEEPCEVPHGIGYSDQLLCAGENKGKDREL